MLPPPPEPPPVHPLDLLPEALPAKPQNHTLKNEPFLGFALLAQMKYLKIIDPIYAAAITPPNKGEIPYNKKPKSSVKGKPINIGQGIFHTRKNGKIKI